MASADDQSRETARALIDTYFKTTTYPYTRHHIDSFNNFLAIDMINIIKTTPILLVKDLIPNTNPSVYRYKVEIFVGGDSQTEFKIGTPTITLQNGSDVRLLFPNEARLRALHYASTITTNIRVRVTYTAEARATPVLLNIPPETFQDIPFFKMPIMLHSGYCILHNKPKEFLREAGECPYDHGGYFIVDGQEKVLVTKETQAFNTLNIVPKDNDPRDPKATLFASIKCLSPKTRRTKTITFRMWKEGQIMVGLPFVKLPVPLFVVFRALGFQSDKEILQLCYPDLATSEAKLFAPKLTPSMVDAWPFLNTFTAIQYIRVLTKGYSEAHVLDILRNQMFTHMPNDPMSQALFLAECVRTILRVSQGFEEPTDKDDTRNHRCMTSGYSIQLLFANAYFLWVKAVKLAIDREWEFNKATYAGLNFKQIFETSRTPLLFPHQQLTELIMRGFKGKWGTGLGEEKTGIIQAMSRLSYCDFISHCRRVILDFDTGDKNPKPRRLHGSQWGYFCTNETPGGASIGISKNMSLLMSFSTGMQMDSFLSWIRRKGDILQCEDLLESQRITYIPLYINGGIFGYCKQPEQRPDEPPLLLDVLKAMKRTGCLPFSTSITFSYKWRRLNVYVDEGRPVRPLFWIQNSEAQEAKLKTLKTWRNLVLGTHPLTSMLPLTHNRFIDPFEADPTATLKQYKTALQPHTGVLEYVDPYEQNEALIAMGYTDIRPETTYMEIHPSTILSFMTAMIPFSHHNQSVRNQLGDSQSKQALSMYATNWKSRFDNTANVLCYGESQLTSTMYTKYLGEGKMPYGHNIILAIAPSGFNQDDGIVFNADSFERGLFRSINYRSYWIREEDDLKTQTKVRIGNPAEIPSWKDIKPGVDYSKLDSRGIIKEGEYCDENTVIVGAYLVNELGQKKDASLFPQVWTRGLVEKVVVLINNANQLMVRVRVVQDRSPELGDKFSNRHGQKGTCGALVRAYDMPRTASGIVPDMIMNPHAIPSRMTIGQNIEQLFGKMLAAAGAIGDGTAFMNTESPEGPIGSLLEKMGFEKYGNELLYNGMTGEQCKAAIFMGPVYGMKLKHMVEDKWQARGQGRKVQLTHQPTGGRGNQGGLKIGEMDRDSLIGHSISQFIQESYMKRSDGIVLPVCTSCGTVPIHNPRLGISQCTLCDGPPVFMGETANTFELLPPMYRQKGKIVNVEIPYATKLLIQELGAITNVHLRIITSGDTGKLRPFEPPTEGTVQIKELKELVFQEVNIPTTIVKPEDTAPTPREIEAYEQGVAAAKAASFAQAAATAPVLDEEDVVEERALGPDIISVQPTVTVGTNVNGQPLVQPINQVIAQQQPQSMLSPQEIAAVRAGLAGEAVPRSILKRSATPPVPFSSSSSAVPVADPLLQPMIGGADVRFFAAPLPGLAPTIAVNHPKNPVFAIDTSPQAMMQDGLQPMAYQSGGQTVTLRRAHVSGSMSAMPSGSGSGSGSGFGSSFGSSGPIMVRKLGAE
jgi:DNA-directed RNA polymerase II subunit RPB2